MYAHQFWWAWLLQFQRFFFLCYAGGTASANNSPKIPIRGGAGAGHASRRPVSQLIDVGSRGGGGERQAFVPQQPNLYPPPSEPAPPPPPRTVSRETNPLPLRYFL